MRRLLRLPLLHFLLIGGVLLALRARWGPVDVARPRIVMAAADLSRLREAWTEEHGVPPDAANEQTLIRAAVDEEVLYREALARGFDRRDEAVRERLVRLGGFVGEETGRDRAALEREARRLGLERGDLVIRRHLVEMMRLAAGWVPAEELPSEPELQEFLRQHAADFALPGRVRLTQVYLSHEARGEAAVREALELLGELRGAGPEAAAGRGDAFIRGADLEGSPAELERMFGPGFAQAVEGAPLRTWVGPVASSYGVHLVWVHAREVGRVAALAEVRGRVVHRWLQERREKREREAIDAMRARYVVEVRS